jgi:hypothetical protein
MAPRGVPMFDTIILVTGAPELAALSAALLGHNLKLHIRPITAPDQFATLEADELAHSRLIVVRHLRRP